MSAELQIKTLGGLRIHLNGLPLSGLHSRKVEALIVYLVATRLPQPREVLADLLWDEQTQASANLRVLLTDLRQVLAPFFFISRATVAVNPESVISFDAGQFEGHLDAAAKITARDTNDSRGAAQELERALALYHGDFLKGFYIRESPRFEEWVLLEQERLRRRAVSALQQLTNVYLGRREYALGIEAATRVFEIDPLNELTQQQLMQLLARSGEHHAALTQYDKYKQLLAVELAAEPSPETTALRDRIRAGTFAEKIGMGARSNLPRTLTPFLGRTRELGELQDKLLDPHISLVTLVGPGGVGKTRLALRTAENLYPHFQDGVAFVALATVTEPNLVVDTIAKALDVSERAGENISTRLKNYLKPKEMVLLLDNFEQVVEAAPLLTELLTDCSRLKILVTSRERLHLYGEQEYPVAALPFPSVDRLANAAEVVSEIANYPAIKLFCQRASAARPDFVLDASNARAVGEICARLEGLPLAIELAAARIHQFSPVALLAQLGARLDLLSAGERNRAARHQTMRAALDWSYALLKVEEKQLFRKLSAFGGGWGLDAAAWLAEPDEALSPHTLNLLNSLVDKSLVQQVTRDSAQPRFTMFETVRAYARERLGEQGETSLVEQQHALYVLTFVRNAETFLEGPSQVQWLEQIEIELDNVRMALQWALDSEQAEIGIETVHRLGRFWTVHDHWTEGRRWLEQLLALPGLDFSSRIYIQGVYSLGLLCFWMSDFSTARTHLERALAMAEGLEDGRFSAQILTALASAYQSLNDLQTADALNEQASELFETYGIPTDLAWSNVNRAGVLLQRGNFAAARPGFQAALDTFLEAGDHWVCGLVYTGLGLVARFMGDPRNANLYKAHALALLTQVNDQSRIGVVHFFLGSSADEQHEQDAELNFFQERLHLMKQQEDSVGIADAELGLGIALHRRGQQAQAQELFKASLLLYLENGQERSAAQCLAGLAGVAAANLNAERAARLFGAADSAKQYVGDFLLANWRTNYGGDLAAASGQLDETTFNRLWAEGQTLTTEQAVALALDDSLT